MASPPSAQDLLGELLWTPGTRVLSGAWLARVEALFTALGDSPRARWMSFERNGYDARTEPANVADVLGPGGDDLVPAVLRARLRYGKVVVAGVAHQWPHFFVEPVDVLRDWEQKVGPGGVQTISVELDVPPGAPGPTALSFARSVFADVLDAIGVEIASALRTAGGVP